MCRFRIQNETLNYQWKDKVTFPALEQSDGCVYLDQTFSEDNRGIRFYSVEISNYESVMAFSDISISILMESVMAYSDYHSPK